ncbi:MAG TPA: alpha/beta hydrolase domain-containing protein [Acidimicrobiales bacterium]
MSPDPSTVAATPTGPRADLSTELTAGGPVFLGEAAAPDLAAHGYEQHEYVASGTASSYVSTQSELPADGRYELVEDQTAAYRTRVLVRRPSRADDSNGTVVVEWLNVSGGVDAGPDFTTMSEELLRSGSTWVGVSAQKIGVEGGPVAVRVQDTGSEVAGKGLKGIDPERYRSLSHPGDPFAYDIYSQVGRALRDPANAEVLGDASPETLIAVGESQSAVLLTTYVNGVQPLAEVYDGFIIHSRFAAGAPVPTTTTSEPPGQEIDIASSMGGRATAIRTDQPWPVLVVQTENDMTSVVGYHQARQHDTDRFRRWEIAGTAHADRRLVGPNADSIDCGIAINDGPQHFVVKAALRAMDTWIRTGQAPPVADELQIDDSTGSAQIVRDPDGIALGGVRTPLVDVPVDVLSGNPGPNPSIICLLLGSTSPLPPERLAELHESRADYLERFDASLDQAIDAGFVLEEDRQELLDMAQPDRIPTS